MDIDHESIRPPSPPAYLPSHQSDAMDDFFTRLPFTQDNPPECSTCFEGYRGMRIQGFCASQHVKLTPRQLIPLLTEFTMALRTSAVYTIVERLHGNCQGVLASAPHF